MNFIELYVLHDNIKIAKIYIFLYFATTILYSWWKIYFTKLIIAVKLENQV